MIENITDKFIDRLIDFKRMTLTDQHVKTINKLFLDYMGVTIVGSYLYKDKLKKIEDSIKTVSGLSYIVGTSRKTDSLHAALLNGTSAHVVELDDGARAGGVHPGAPVFSAVLSMICETQVDKETFYKSILIGYETVLRFAKTMQPSHKLNGFHATGTCGTIGAAMASSIIKGDSREEMKHTLSAATTLASGILKVIHDGSTLKPLNAGQAAMNGILASQIGRSGLIGPTDVLEGNLGFINMMSQKNDISKLLSVNDDLLAIDEVYLKPYAACRHCHPAIEAALLIKSKNNIISTKIADISVSTYKLGLHGHNHIIINGVNSAKMSTPYSIAAALVFGVAGLDQFNEISISNTHVTELCKRVKMSEDLQMTALVPEFRPAKVKIKYKSGEVFEERVDLPKGEPENPLSDEEVLEKFYSLVAYAGMEKEHSKNIANQILNCDFDTHEIIKLLAY